MGWATRVDSGGLRCQKVVSSDYRVNQHAQCPIWQLAAWRAYDKHVLATYNVYMLISVIGQCLDTGKTRNQQV